MFGIGSRALSFASPRVLLSSFLLLGLISGQGGRGTLAYFTSAAQSAANTFEAGQLTLTGSTINGIASTFDGATDAKFSWTIASGVPAATSANCDVTAAASNGLNTTQPMVPGTFCVAPITLTNDGNIDMWGRFRVIKTATADNLNVGSAAALNKALEFFMAEYDTSVNRNNDCTTTNFRPSATNDTATITPGTGGTKVMGLSANTPKAFGANKLNTVATAGMNLANTVATINETNTTSAGASGYYYNLVGSDAVDGTSSSTTFTAGDGKALFTASTSRYYCAAVFFPANTDPNASITGAAGALDNTTQKGSNTYTFQFVGAQRSGRS